MDEARQRQIFETLLTLADTLVDDFDVIELAERLVSECRSLLDVSQAGILLDDQQGGLHVLASTSEEMRLLEFFELQADEGPCVDAVATGQLVEAPDLAGQEHRWPLFVPQARGLGFQAAYSVPLRLRDHTIGALNLFGALPGRLSTSDLQVAQVLARMATIGLMSYRALREQEVVAQQLQQALASRVTIEQAKGVLAERIGVDMARAFDLLRATARSNQRSLSDVAREIATSRSADAVQQTISASGADD